MVAIAEEAFFKLSKAERDRFNGILLYGTDEGQIAAAQRRIIVGFKSEEQPLHLTGSEFRSDPGLLEASFLGMPLFGGRRLIHVDGVDESHVGILTPVLSSDAAANFVVMTAGSLNKSSALRGAAEVSRRFHAIGFYEETEAEVAARAKRLLASLGLSAEVDVAERLAELSGGDRGVLEGEAEKLGVYLKGSDRVTLADVDAICGNASAFDPASLVEAMVGGDLESAEVSMAAARDSGETGQMLNAMKWHLDRMHAVRLAYEQSNNWEQAMGRARPPVHFKVKDRWRNLLSRTTGQQLDQLQLRLQDAILATRKHASISDVLSERFVLASAREMRGSNR
jgi:DNA polymerase III subunit delta